MCGLASKNWPSGYLRSPTDLRNSLNSSCIGLMTCLKRLRYAACAFLSLALAPDRCGGMSGSSISFSEHEMILT
jgi:hypothetical protein